MESNKQKFKRLRTAFREAVFARDKHKCVFCNVVVDLDAHHITDRHLMPNDGYTSYNGITLCTEHHLMAEEFHISEGKNWFPGFHPDTLYKIIGSSYGKALEESRKLK
jgi:predicted restriction endonuclease